MDAVSDGALCQLPNDVDRNTYLPDQDSKTFHGLRILFYSVYWTTAFHYLGLHPGNVFPRNRCLIYEVHDQSVEMKSAEGLGLLKLSNVPDNIPEGSMFRTNKNFLWHRISKYQVTKQGIPFRAISGAYDLKTNEPKDNGSKKNSNREGGKKDSETKSTSRTEDMDMGNDNIQCQVPDKPNCTSNLSGSKDLHHQVFHRQNVMYIFQALMTNILSTPEDDIPPGRVFKISDFLSLLAEDNHIQQAIQDTDFVPIALKAIRKLAKLHINGLTQEKRIKVQEDVNQINDHLFGKQSHMINLPEVVNAIKVMEDDLAEFKDSNKVGDNTGEKNE